VPTPATPAALVLVPAGSTVESAKSGVVLGATHYHFIQLVGITAVRPEAVEGILGSGPV
jgi:hypothetical protein